MWIIPHASVFLWHNIWVCSSKSEVTIKLLTTFFYTVTSSKSIYGNQPIQTNILGQNYVSHVDGSETESTQADVLLNCTIFLYANAR